MWCKSWLKKFVLIFRCKVFPFLFNFADQRDRAFQNNFTMKMMKINRSKFWHRHWVWDQNLMAERSFWLICVGWAENGCADMSSLLSEDGIISRFSATIWEVSHVSISIMRMLNHSLPARHAVTFLSKLCYHNYQQNMLRASSVSMATQGITIVTSIPLRNF